MAYELLSKQYYKDRDGYEEEYRRRWSDPSAVHLKLEIQSFRTQKSWPAFFLQTPELCAAAEEIRAANARVRTLCGEIPAAALEQFSQRCLIDEIMLTNDIEGVASTRKEISAILSAARSPKKRPRFYGLVRKYAMLSHGGELPLETCADIRAVYDDLVLPEVKEEDPGEVPDGKYFRKDSVSVCNSAQREIHRGMYPEEKIIRCMETILDFLQEDSCGSLFRIAVFHYCLGYIHPFYNGNGRLGRFICSYQLSRELEPVVGYRLSYTIKKNINQYYKAFEICNDPLNRGDLTPFLEMFLQILQESLEKLEAALSERIQRLSRSKESPPDWASGGDMVAQLYEQLVEAALFSEMGLSNAALKAALDVSRTTISRRLKQIPSQLLRKEKQGKTDLYSLDIDALES